MTLDEAYDAFSEMADRLSNPRYIAGQMSQELDQVVYRMRQLAPQDSGKLRSSIALLSESTGQNLSVALSMLDYGFYQNFGVKPNAQTPFNALSDTMAQRRQPYGVDEVTETPFSYSNRTYGLPATVFFDLDELRDQVAFIAENNIQEIVDNID